MCSQYISFLVTWEQIEDPLWIIIRLITAWVPELLFCLSVFELHDASVAFQCKEFSLVWFDGPKVQEIMKMLLRLLSSFLALSSSCSCAFSSYYTNNFIIILQFLAFLLVCSIGLDISGKFHSFISICTKVNHPAFLSFERVGFSCTDAKMWESSCTWGFFDSWDRSQLSFYNDSKLHFLL